MKIRTIETPKREAPLYLRKAVQFMKESEAALAASRSDAAMLNAIHAVISAGDAVSVALSGMRSADPDHQRAGDVLLAAVGPDQEGKRHTRQFRELIAKKSVVEYESRQATAKEARDAVVRAERFVRWASDVVGDDPASTSGEPTR